MRDSLLSRSPTPTTQPHTASHHTFQTTQLAQPIQPPSNIVPVFTAQATHTAQPPAHLPSLLPVHRPISHRPLSTPPPRSGGPVQIDRRDAHTRARRLPGDRRHDDLPRRRDRGDCQPVPCTAIIKQGQLHYHATSAMCGISGTSDTSVSKPKGWLCINREFYFNNNEYRAPNSFPPTDYNKQNHYNEHTDLSPSARRAVDGILKPRKSPSDPTTSTGRLGSRRHRSSGRGHGR